MLIVTAAMALPLAGLCEATSLRRTGLLGEGVLPCYRRDAEAGESFLFEQRYFLSFLGVKDGVEFRHNEHKRRHLEHIAADLPLDEHIHYIRPSDSCGFNTVVFDSMMLIAWLMHLPPRYHRNREKLRLIHQLIANYASISERGYMMQAVQTPLSVFGQDLVIGNETSLAIDLSPILCVWDVATEWRQLNAGHNGFTFKNLPENSVVQLVEFTLFVASREAAGEEPSPMLTSLKKGLFKVMAMFFEVAIAGMWETGEVLENRVPITPLVGRSGHRRQRMGVAQKMKLVEDMIKHCGSDEVLLSAQHLGHGVAAVVKAARNRVYFNRVAARFANTAACCLQWDEATHGGVSVNVGLLVDVGTDHGAYLKPAVDQTDVI